MSLYCSRVLAFFFAPAWNKSATRENAISGFHSTGIYPLNPLAILDSAFGPSEASDRRVVSAVSVNQMEACGEVRNADDEESTLHMVVDVSAEGMSEGDCHGHLLTYLGLRTVRGE